MLVGVGSAILERSAPFLWLARPLWTLSPTFAATQPVGPSRRGAFVSTVAHAWALRSDLLAAVTRLERVEQRRDGIARWFFL